MDSSREGGARWRANSRSCCGRQPPTESVFVSATRAYVKGSVRCAIAESLHGMGPMRCSYPVHMPRGRWLDVPGSSQEMAGKCSKRFQAAESEDVHC